jgi:hypothetical protein
MQIFVKKQKVAKPAFTNTALAGKVARIFVLCHKRVN